MDQSILIQGTPVKPGERVVYPNGGICRVKGVESKQIAGMSLLMLMLEREEDGATVMVPENKVASIGLRKVATAGAMDVLFDFLTHSSADPELDWKVRHRDNFEKMAAGGLLDTAEVLKGLHALAKLRGALTTRDREEYDRARHQLIGEISASANVPLAVAENNIDYALDPPPGSGREAPKDRPIDLKVLRRSVPRRAGSMAESESDDEFESDEEEDDELLGGVTDEQDEERDEDQEADEAVEERSAAASAPVKKTVKKATAKKTTAKKAAAKKSTAKKTTAKKTAAKKTTAKKAVAKKSGSGEPSVSASKSVSSKSAPKKAVAKKTTTKKAPAKKGER